jgi:hypothetical protein
MFTCTGPHTKRYNTAPVLAPEMKATTNGPDCQTFRRRWNLADPTTAAEPGIRAPERQKKSLRNLTPPNKIRAVARAPLTPVTWAMSSKIPGYGNLVYEAPIVHTRRSGCGDSGIYHKGKGMDDGSFNSMSPLLRNSGPHGSWQAGSCCTHQ